MFVAGVLLIVLGTIVWSLARIGFAVGSHPFCRACSFDLFGLPLETARCPECGSDILMENAVRIGHRQPVRSGVISGLVMGLAGAALLGACTLAWWSDFDGSRYKPTALLERDITSPSGLLRSRACIELQRRIQTDSLSQAQINQLAREILKLQADTSGPWHGRWGDLIQASHERPAGRPALLNADWRRYLSQCVQIAARIRPRIRIDDPVPIALTCRLRAGTQYAEIRPATLTPEAKLSLGTLTGVLRGRAVSLDSIPVPLEWSLLWLPARDRAGNEWPATIQPGPQSLQVTLAMTINAGSVTAVHEQTMILPFELLDRAQPSITLVHPANADRRQEMADALRFRGPTNSQRQLVLDAHNPAQLWVSGPPVCAAFRVVLRQGGHEWGLASFLVRPNDAASIVLSAPPRTGPFVDGPGEIVCIPNPELASGTVDVLETWGEEIHRPVMLKIGE